MKKINKDIGSFSEDLAKKYLEKNDYSILDCNFKNFLGEIDIICKKNNLLIIVEVKSRYNNNYGSPRESVNFSKQRSIIKVANSYINYKRLPNINVRFDVIEVYLNLESTNFKINHIKDAFRLN
ncbi:MULTISPECIES: YraN family protein [Clostridium]|uniref:YraN family protein n=1 Tax=Clostridium TaxID=1485 RepID=UPI000308B2FB|nr:YraN family protein [Clostridium beijerinckii]ALB47484.1 YraN family protein [Clostridium beijerinckii NRRL B-598]NRT77157.1 putative endonuclease [Clostridium beijerinckii]OOM49945.1 hypothetical protein CBEIJ_09140 [Clostridium beijerinckii]